ncbi:MAG: GAF domain-containing protein, partial [Bacteroidales bacterium]|nr:GAF domain-containing protein [Bacteroidales bacterium]
MKKLSAIPKKLYYFFLILILFSVTIVIVLSILHLHIRKIHSAEVQLLQIKEKIETINARHYEYLALVLYGKNDDQDIFHYADRNMDDVLFKLTDLTGQLAGHRVLRKRTDVSASLETFNTAISDFSGSITAVMSSIKERGNMSEGLISEWFRQAGEIEVNGEEIGQDFITGLEKVRALQSAYILTNNNALIDELNNLLISLQSQLPVDDMVNPGKFDALLQLTAKILALNNRIGFSSHQGELPVYYQHYETLKSNFEKLVVLINENLNRATFSASLLSYGLIVLLLAGMLLLAYIFLDKSILRPLIVIGQFVNRLSSGMIPDDSLTITESGDPGGISEPLNKLAKGLKEKTDFARDLNQGHYSTKLELLSDKDDLGLEMKKLQENIISSSEEQDRYNEENAKRRYINEGLARFANILRLNSNNLDNLGDAFIRELVKYLNAIQGGFFMVDEEDKEKPVLRLAAAFAYNRKKYLEKTILLGEGLVGTCAIEKKTVHLTEMPRGYILITSGLGDAPPDNLLLVPVMHEEELIGVLEIASLNKFSEHEIAFTEEVASNLGSTIVTTRINQRTSELLAKSQQQAQEMAEQEEEMRQNMEELKATQEESSRREEEFSGIVDSLNLSVFIIEYDLDGTISYINNKFLLFINKKSEELIGKTHPYVFGVNSVVDSKFWAQLSNMSNTTVAEDLSVGKKIYRIKE